MHCSTRASPNPEQRRGRLRHLWHDINLMSLMNGVNAFSLLSLLRQPIFPWLSVLPFFSSYFMFGGNETSPQAQISSNMLLQVGRVARAHAGAGWGLGL